MKERFETSRIYLCANQPFFGTLVLNLRLQDPRPDVKTAAVSEDGSVYFDTEFAANLTDSEFRGVLLHEVLHVAFDVFGRQGSRAMGLWNQAHDYVINLMINGIDDRRITLPHGTLLDHKYRGWSAEDVYEDLLDEQQENPGRQGYPGGGLGLDCRSDLGGSTSYGTESRTRR